MIINIMTLTGSDSVPVVSRFWISVSFFPTLSASSVDCACFCWVAISRFVPNTQHGDAFTKRRNEGSRFLSNFRRFHAKNIKIVYVFFFSCRFVDRLRNVSSARTMFHDFSNTAPPNPPTLSRGPFPRCRKSKRMI